MAQEKDRYTVPENQLQEILALYDSNQVEASGAAIRNFLTSFPDHPVSALLMERGY
jgi:outer membrane protein assembly factor BamD (BamD/ComL family)